MYLRGLRGSVLKSVISLASVAYSPGCEQRRTRLLPCGKSALGEQRLDVRIAPAEPAVGLGPVARVSVRQDVRPHPRRERLVPGTRLDERLPRVGGHDVRPQIAVIPRGVRIAAEQVIEVRQPVSQGDLARHADACELVALEGGHVHGAVGPRVQLHVQDRRRQVLHRRVALVELLRLLDPVDQRLRHRLPVW